MSLAITEGGADLWTGYERAERWSQESKARGVPGTGLASLEQELCAPREHPEIKASPGRPLTVSSRTSWQAGCSLVALTTGGRNLRDRKLCPEVTNHHLALLSLSPPDLGIPGACLPRALEVHPRQHHTLLF